MSAPGDVETVTVIRPPAKDLFGDLLPGDSTEFDIDGCLIAPGGSDEVNFVAGQVDSDLKVYGPAGMPPVLPTDRMLVRGLVYRVVGEPQVWGTAGVVVALRKVTG